MTTLTEAAVTILRAVVAWVIQVLVKTIACYARWTSPLFDWVWREPEHRALAT
jgi:hypothetical protein